MPARVKARFIEPMLLLRTNALPADGSHWEYQLEFDGYRAIAYKSNGALHLRSRNDKGLQRSVGGRDEGPREVARRDGDRRRGDRP